MTTTYSGDPATSPKDAVRFYLHDKADPWLFTDEEIDYQLSEMGSVYLAAAELAMVQGASYTDRRDKTVGPLSIKYGEIGDRWYALAKSLRQRGARASGAIAITTQKTRAPYFTLGMHDIHKTDAFSLLGSDPRDLTVGES